MIGEMPIPYTKICLGLPERIYSETDYFTVILLKKLDDLILTNEFSKK